MVDNSISQLMELALGVIKPSTTLPWVYLNINLVEADIYFLQVFSGKSVNTI